MPAIFGVCADANPATASRRIPEVGTRLDPGIRMTVFSERSLAECDTPCRKSE
jgi:hypothetical protein